jgi:hypothetical protein
MLTLLAPGTIPGDAWRQPLQEKNGPPQGTSMVPNGWKETVNKLSTFRNLEEDWDGQGANAPSGELVDSACALAALFQERGLDPPTAVAPGPGGTVLFVWQEKNGTYCEVEVERPFHAEVMLIEPGQPARHWVLPDEV